MAGSTWVVAWVGKSLSTVLGLLLSWWEISITKNRSFLFHLEEGVLKGPLKVKSPQNKAQIKKCWKKGEEDPVGKSPVKHWGR